MNDWVPANHKWITAGYTAFRRKRKQKDSQQLFQKFVRHAFKEKGIDIDEVRAGPPMFRELFWQIETLKEWVFSLTRLAAYQGLQTRKLEVELKVLQGKKND